jgi:hypothetical protein
MEYKYIWIIIRDRARLYLIGFGPGWQLSEAHIAFVPPVSIKGRSLLWMIVRSQTSYPKHILVTLLSWVPTLFGPTFRGGY